MLKITEEKANKPSKSYPNSNVY